MRTRGFFGVCCISSDEDKESNGGEVEEIDALVDVEKALLGLRRPLDSESEKGSNSAMKTDFGPHGIGVGLVEPSILGSVAEFIR